MIKRIVVFDPRMDVNIADFVEPSSSLERTKVMDFCCSLNNFCSPVLRDRIGVSIEYNDRVTRISLYEFVNLITFLL